jgi:hypothetical protein
MIKLKKIIKEDLFETDIEHTVGNALFAMETNLISLKKRIQDGRTEEALKITDNIQQSIEKAKEGLWKWKNRTS